MNELNEENEKLIEEADETEESEFAVEERDGNGEVVVELNDNDGEEPKKPFSEILDWTSCFVYALAAVLALNLFVFRSITVSGNSMNDTLVNQDRVIATNLFYTPHYGDIVIVEADKLHLNGTAIYGETIIKRVIATEGDTIRIDFMNGIVYRNGEVLEEDYIKEPIRVHYQGWMEHDKEYTVPEHCVFVMGDNRNASNDSRNLADVGFVDVNYIMGKAFVRYAPFSSFKWL